MKILAVGDGARLTSGFGRVMRETLHIAKLQGHQIVHIAALDAAPVTDPSWYTMRGIHPVFTAGADTVGVELLGPVIAHHEPDVILAIGDAMTVAAWCDQRRRLAGRMPVPVVAYIPIEGAPLSGRLVEALRRPDRVIVCTKWGSEVAGAALGRQIDWVHHGVNPTEWQPFREDRTARDRVRASLGWGTHDLVISYIARNQYRKAHDKLIEALGIARRMGVPARLYLHCAQWERGWNGGWNLSEIAQWEEVEEYVQFPALSTSVHGPAGQLLAERLAASDLYVSPSKVEGFGLPLLEAMAAGTPVVYVDDGGNQSEVAGGGGCIGMQPSSWDTWHNGAKLAIVSAEHIANEIRHFYLNAGDRDWLFKQMDRGYRWATAERFSWQRMAERLLAECATMVAAQPRSAELAAV